MKTLASRALLALMMMALIAACTRTVDNTDEDNNTNNTADVQATEDTANVDEDTTVEPGDDTTETPPTDIVLPEGCGTIDLTVADLQQREEGLNCEEPAQGENGFINLDQGAELNCLIVTAPVHSRTETLDGFFVADVAGGPYSGILVVMDKGTAPNLAIGDTVSLVGDLKEYYCLSEFDVPDVKVYDNAGDPAPLTITPEEFNADPEKYEGVLVAFEGVQVLEHDTYGGFKIDGNIIVDDLIMGEGEMPRLDPGCTYDSLVGVVDYGYGKYKVLPRETDDLQGAEGECEVVEPTTQTIAELQQSDASMTCSDEDFVNMGEVSLEGLIAATPRFVVSDGKLHGFFATTPDATGPFAGIVVVTTWNDDIDLEVGTEFDLEADWTEAFCNTQIKAMKLTETGNNLADKIAFSVISADDLGEDYESVMVTLDGPFTVEEEVNNYGEVKLTDGVIIKLKFDGVEWNPAVGTIVDKVHGPIYYYYNKYMVMPVSDGDIELL